MPESKYSVRFNVKRIVYAEIIKDDASGFTYGPIKTFAEPMQVQMTYSLAQGKVYGGGVQKVNMAKVTGATLKIDVNKLAIEVKADIYGNTYADGVRTVGKDDQAKEIAIGYEMESTGDNREFDWLLKGTPQPAGKSTQQTTDNINFSTDTIDINFVPRAFDGALHKDADTANPDFTTVKAETFLATIPGGTLAA